MTEARKTKRELLQYGILAFPLAFVGLPVYLHAPSLYASGFGISLTTIGSILLVLRIFDAIQDPIIGSLSDTFHHLRTPIILIGMIAMMTGFWMIFHPNPNHLILYFALGVALCTTGFSVVSINFQTIGGLWHATSFDRTRITSWREAIGLIGLLCSSIAPSLLGVDTNPDKAFHLLCLLYIPILAISAWVFFLWMKKHPLEYTPISSPIKSTSQASFLQLADRWSLHFFGIYLLNTFASSIPAVLVLFFINDRLNATELTGLFLLLYFLSGVISMPLWTLIANSFGKEKSWLASMCLATITFVWAFTLSSGDRTPFMIVCILSGSALGADLALPPAIIAEKISQKNQQLIASRYFSLMTFLSKAALALATGSALPALGLLGYQPGDVSNYHVTNYLIYAYALIPSLLKSFSALWLWRFLSISHSSQSSHSSDV